MANEAAQRRRDLMEPSEAAASKAAARVSALQAQVGAGDVWAQRAALAARLGVDCVRNAAPA
jgi:hypothetical protein